jgi:hypothetical protein
MQLLAPQTSCCACRHLPTAAELQRNIDRLTTELHATRVEQQQLQEELLALHAHADLETAQVRLCCQHQHAQQLQCDTPAHMFSRWLEW